MTIVVLHKANHELFVYCNVLIFMCLCLQCFDTVGWAPGKTSGL